jgi:hypothetical protein
MGYPQGSFSYGAAIGLFIPLQLPLSPMGVFAIGIEHALDIAVLRRCWDCKNLPAKWRKSSR